MEKQSIDNAKLMNLQYSLEHKIELVNKTGAYLDTSIVGCNNSRNQGLMVCKLPQMNDAECVLLSALDEKIQHDNYSYDLNVRQYSGWNHTEGLWHIKEYQLKPVPTVTYCAGAISLTKQIIFAQNESTVFVKYTLKEGSNDITLSLSPFLAFRATNNLVTANNRVNQSYSRLDNGIACSLYNQYPELYMLSNKPMVVKHNPHWHYNFEYQNDKVSGNAHEDLFVPCTFDIRLREGESAIFVASLNHINASEVEQKFIKEFQKTIKSEETRTTTRSLQHRNKKAENAYLARHKQTSRVVCFDEHS